MLGAHSDSVAEGPGINDDGSGTISLLEVATQLTKFNVSNCVRFAWWVLIFTTLSTFWVVPWYLYEANADLNQVGGWRGRSARLRSLRVFAFERGEFENKDVHGLWHDGQPQFRLPDLQRYKRRQPRRLWRIAGSLHWLVQRPRLELQFHCVRRSQRLRWIHPERDPWRWHRNRRRGHKDKAGREGVRRQGWRLVWPM
jgi:hypothetical protein